jgi:chromate transporter
MSVLLALFVVCAQLSIIAIGGATAVLPELQRQVVDVHHWMDATAFGALFALAQAAPGPNVLVVTLVGWQVAGIAGALVATVGILLPSGLLTWCVAGAWHRFRDRPWRAAIQAGLVPVTVGLIMAAAALLAAATTTGWAAGLLTTAVAILTLKTKLHPLLLLATGAAIGALGLV